MRAFTGAKSRELRAAMNMVRLRRDQGKRGENIVKRIADRPNGDGRCSSCYLPPHQFLAGGGT